MAAAPAIVKFVGGTPQDAIQFTTRMYEITVAENSGYQIPALDFRGSPTGIDVCKVVETGILPVVNTGIAHKEPGVGMVGAGLLFGRLLANFNEIRLIQVIQGAALLTVALNVTALWKQEARGAPRTGVERATAKFRRRSSEMLLPVNRLCRSNSAVAQPCCRRSSRRASTG